MASLLKSCKTMFFEVVVYLWCNATRLLFHLWFCWQKPRPLPPVKDDIILRSATSLAAAIRKGEVKSVEVVSAYIKRIREVQPIINAVVEERFEEALQEAEAADHLVASGTMSVQQLSQAKPLLGVPVSVKDSIAVKGGEGSLLASAGSLIGLGTDIGGSVRVPAAYCGIFSHKPTAGVVPNTGIFPDVGDNMREYVCVGPMVRFSEDLPLLLRILAGNAAERLKLDEEVDMGRLKVFFTETEGSLYISRVTAEARQAVVKVPTEPVSTVCLK